MLRIGFRLLYFNSFVHLAILLVLLVVFLVIASGQHYSAMPNWQEAAFELTFASLLIARIALSFFGHLFCCFTTEFPGARPNAVNAIACFLLAMTISTVGYSALIFSAEIRSSAKQWLPIYLPYIALFIDLIGCLFFLRFQKSIAIFCNNVDLEGDAGKCFSLIACVILCLAVSALMLNVSGASIEDIGAPSFQGSHAVPKIMLVLSSLFAVFGYTRYFMLAGKSLKSISANQNDGGF